MKWNGFLVVLREGSLGKCWLGYHEKALRASVEILTMREELIGWGRQERFAQLRWTAMVGNWKYRGPLV